MFRSLIRTLGLGVPIVVASIAARPAVAQTLPVVLPQVNDPWFSGLTIPANATTQGMWSSVFSWPIVALHLGLLPDGEVLSFGTPVGVASQEGRIFDRWSPLAPSTHATLPNSQNVNSFCAAGILQSTGTLLVSGGNAPRESTIFNYANNSATTQASRLAFDRWYGTVIMLADGRSLMTGGGAPYVVGAWQNPAGNLGNVAMTPEVFTPGSGWASLLNANSRDAFGPDHNRWWYPRNWVAPNGEVFGISSEKMWYLNTAGNGSIRTVGTFKTGFNNTTRPNIGPTSTAVMYDVGRILQAGGNGYQDGQATNSSALATTFDIRNGDPVIAETNPMAFARQWANSTVLPNGRVLVTGGTAFGNNGGTDAVRAAEWWNPATGAWSTLASAVNIRNYHAASLLLPSGVVLITGGGVPGPVNNFNGEIYYPPYLFQASGSQSVLAPRPRMVSVSALRADYGGTLQIEMADTSAVSRVLLIGVGSTTHSFDMGQRFIPLSYSQSGAILTMTAPASGNIAPPGYYLVYAVNQAGVPSRGLIISVAATAPPTPPQPPPAGSDPVAVYPFDATSGTVATDSSGSARHGTLVGGATWTAGRTGNAVRLSGTNQYVQLPSGIVSGCTDFTFAGWVNLAANPNWNRIFDFGSGTATNMFLTARANGAILRFAIKNNNSAEQLLSYGVDLSLGQWRHVAVTITGTTGRLYLDGVEVAQNAAMTIDPANLGNTPNNWLGRSQYPDPYMNGSLDEVRLSCRAYTAAEIRALAIPPGDLVAHYSFDETAGTVAHDASTNGRNGTLVGGATRVAGRKGNAVRLSGVNQYVDLPDALASACTDFTFAGWVNLAAATNWTRIFDYGSGTATNMFLTPRAGGTTLRFAIRNNNGAEQQISYAYTFPTNTWKHVAVTISGTTGRLYLDGAQVAQNTNLTLDPANLGAVGNVWLGRSQYAADPYLNATLDDVRVSCRAYSAAEITTLAQ